MSATLDIRLDGLRGPEVAALLREHLDEAQRNSPPESVHALDLDGLRAPEVTFWSAWFGADLAGCSALKELDPRHGELKSMRTAAAQLRKGVAAALVEHMLGVARARGYRRLSLETGSSEVYAPARALYTRFGFELCPPFADYPNDPNSLWMTRELRPS